MCHEGRCNGSAEEKGQMEEQSNHHCRIHPILFAPIWPLYQFLAELACSRVERGIITSEVGSALSVRKRGTITTGLVRGCEPSTNNVLMGANPVGRNFASAVAASRGWNENFHRQRSKSLLNNPNIPHLSYNTQALYKLT